MSASFKIEMVDEAIGLLTFDMDGEKVNTFNEKVMTELADQARELAANKAIKCLLVMSGKKDTFIAGADVREIQKLTDREQGYQVSRRGQEVFGLIDELPFPTVAVVDGACMGGGTELILACDYRLVTDNPKTKIALPEVTLGILPGWGGTVRLPRLIGLQNALDMILTGRRVVPRKALRMGLADKIIAAEWAREKAIEFAREIMAGQAGKYLDKRKSRGAAAWVLEKTPFGRKILFSQAEKMVRKQTHGHYPAPLRALRVVRDGYGKSLSKALEIEARGLAELIITPICKNLVQIYFWTQEIKKENGVAGKKPKTIPVHKAAVLGAGVMGGGIAQLFASNNIPVRVKDIQHEAVAKAYEQAASVLKYQLKRRKITRFEYMQIMHRITGTTDYKGFSSVDLVVEAIVEDLEIKKKVLTELEKQVAKETLIATNTSSLRIDDMASALKSKKRFVGLHFFNPVHRMPLVEVVRGKHTSDEAVATVFNLVKGLGKTPIVVNDGPGFLVNRLLLPYMVEAISLLEEGNSIQMIDKAMLNFGMPMGPIELFDEVGIDVAYKVAKILQQSMGDRMAESDLLHKMVEAGRLGKKSKIGFYLFQGKEKKYDPGITKFITIKSKRPMNEQDLVKRMVYPMVNEAARCLGEGIVQQARDVDLGMIFGTGFAPFRGGLLKYADALGLDSIIDQLKIFADTIDPRFAPSDSLKKIAGDQKMFYPEMKN